jgi:uncharacterized protein YjiS (DUF1127 family)
MFTELLQRRAKLRAYRQVREDLDRLSERDLADMGLKRYQLGHAARVKALG